MKLTTAVVGALLALAVSPGHAQKKERVKEATDLILRLCIASGVQNIEITKKGNSIELSSIELSGQGSSLQIERQESSGLVGGISKEITALSAQQASEARSCTQKYLKELVDIILKDEPGNQVRGSDQSTVHRQASVNTDPETFWGGRGIWQDNKNYCERLLAFLSASSRPANFRYSDNGEQVSLGSLSSATRRIKGNYIVRTEPGSTAEFCTVFKEAYNGLACARVVSFGMPDVFASVYNQTLKDMRDCLLPAGWTQTSVDQGACIPRMAEKSECVRRFTKDSRSVWLFSQVTKTAAYVVGIQTRLGD